MGFILMKHNLTIVCHKAYCQETKTVIYQGKYIGKWYCDKHKNEMQIQQDM